MSDGNEPILYKAHNQSTQPLVSVCIPNFNGTDYVVNCIYSVVAQDFPHQIEIIVHDDASTDDSVSLIRRLYPDVELLVSPTNVGFCVSNNRMVAHSRSKYILLLNNDATLHPGSLRAFLAEAECTTTPAVLGLPQRSLTDGTLLDRGYEFDLFLNPIPRQEAGTHEVSTVTGACMWIPREVWDAVGGFPEWFGSVAEDIYLCHAARLLGYPVKVLDNPPFDHWIGRNLGGGKLQDNRLVSTVRRRALSERNKTWVMMICYPLPLLLLALPLHFFLLMLEALFLLLTGTNWTKVYEIYLTLPSKLVVNIVDIYYCRSTLQAYRCLSSTEYFKSFHLVPWKLSLFIKHGLPRI